VGIFEMIALGLATLVGMVTVTVEPTDIYIEHIYVAEEYEQLGLEEETVRLLLSQKIARIQADAGISPLDSDALRIDFDESAIAQFAEDLGIMRHVNNIQMMLDQVDHRMHISIYSSEENETEFRDIIEELTVDIHLLETRSGRIIKSVKIKGPGEMLPLLEKVAENIIKLAKPGSHALGLFVKELPDSHRDKLIVDTPAPNNTFAGTEEFINEWLVIHGGGAYELLGVAHSRSYKARLMETRSKMYNLLGLIHMVEGELVYAAKSFRKVIQVNKNDASGYVNMGATLGYQGHYDQALKFLRKGLALDKEKPITYLYAAAVLLKQGHYDKALKVLDKLETMPLGTGIADLYKLKAEIYRELGRSGEAIKRLQQLERIAKFKNPYQFSVLTR
jgi:Tfp pilus assembly protein PilF